MRTLTVGLACLVITLAAVPPLPAQDATDGPSVQWSLVSSDFADLWFGGLAQVGFMGFDSVPLYDAAYASGVRGHKVAQGVGQTLLDRDADGLRIMFEADPAFEVLHFVPVYFAGVGRAETLDALEAIAESPSGIPDAPSTGSRFGTTAVATVLTERDQREILGEFVAALRDDWTLYLRSALDEDAAARDASLARLRARWDEAYAPPPIRVGRRRGCTGRVVGPPARTLGRSLRALPSRLPDAAAPRVRHRHRVADARSRGTLLPGRSRQLGGQHRGSRRRGMGDLPRPGPLRRRAGALLPRGPAGLRGGRGPVR